MTDEPLTIHNLSSLAQMPEFAVQLAYLPTSGEVWRYIAPTPIGGRLWQIFAVETKESE